MYREDGGALIQLDTINRRRTKRWNARRETGLVSSDRSDGDARVDTVFIKAFTCHKLDPSTICIILNERPGDDPERSSKEERKK